MKLVIGNKNYSSWSMRPWVALREARIPFEEVLLKFGADGKPVGVAAWSPTRKVPSLVLDEGEVVWDSLAICETVAELHPEKALWPADPAARRAARAVCAEMHSGFQALREQLVMNIRARHPGKGINGDSRKDIDRVVEIWLSCRARFGAGGELLFGAFSIADAFYAPVVTRFETYGVALPAVAQAYCEAVRRLASVREWTEAALRETELVPADEPYAAR
ncbi:MAG TPA: glutathione S-transferase family protein [Burkholderiales bacterium]|nr:glutathione S-transferase family protein [Burkholderiales bacterium]